MSVSSTDLARSAAASPQEGGAAAEPVNTPASLPMYLAALVITVCGLLTVHLLLGDPGFTNLTVGLCLIGFCVSFLSRKQNVAPRSIEMPAAILCVCLALMAFLSDQVLPFLAPADVGDDRAKALSVLLTWLVVFRSFTLIADGALLFCCVPTLAIMGLVGTMTADPLIVTYFVLSVSAAAFMLVHENFLRTRRTQVVQRRRDAEKLLFTGQIQLAALCCIGAMLLANLAAVPLRAIGSQIVLTPSLNAGMGKASAISSTTPVSFSERGEMSLGSGPVKLSNQIVMRVKANAGSLWRGTSYNEYTGRAWRNSIGDDRALNPDGSSAGGDDLLNGDQTPGNMRPYTMPPSVFDQPHAGGSRLKQEVRLESGLFSEIYAAPDCKRVWMGESSARTDQSGAIHFNRPVSNATYLVESEVPDASPDTLRAAGASYPRAITDQYLAMKSGAEMDQVRQQAKQVVEGISNPYDKVMALEAWLGKQCKYNLDTPAFPIDKDAAAFFLFTAKQGYCDSFASALALLCRSVGIPARVASGFLPGTFDSGQNEYQVREKDKHAWTEVYFPRAGWIAFDATGDAEDITGQDANGAKRKGLLALLFSRGLLPPVCVALFLGLLGYVLKVELIDRLRPRRRLPGALVLPETNAAIVEAYVLACRVLDGRGLPRLASATPREYAAASLRRLELWPEAGAALERLTSLVDRYRYSGETATADDVRIAREAGLALRRGLKGVSRRRMLALAEAG